MLESKTNKKSVYIELESDFKNSAPLMSAQLTPGADTQTGIAPVQL